MDRLADDLGYDLGDFKLLLESSTLCAGSTLRGRFRFRFSRRIEARKVCVQLEARHTWTEFGPTGNRTDYTESLFESTLYLDGPGSYDSADYRFAFDLPEDAPCTDSSRPGESLSWLLRGWVDIPWGPDPVREESVEVLQPGSLPPPQPAVACRHCGALPHKPTARFCPVCGQSR